MKAQVSIEYLIIIGVAIGILIPGILFFYSYSKASTGSSTSAQLNDIGLSIMTEAKNTYAMGTSAWHTVEFTMPDTVTRVYVNTTDTSELIFLYDTPQGQSSAVFFSMVNLTTANSDGNVSTAHPGATKYRLTSAGSAINITETT